MNRWLEIMVKTLFVVVQSLPNRSLASIATVLSPVVRLFARKERRILDQNLSLILGLPRHTRGARDFGWQVVRSQIAIGLESIKAVGRPTAIRVDGLEDLREAMLDLEACGRGQIMISGHLGSWEMIALQSAALTGKTYYALAKPAHYSWVTRALDWQRARMGIKVLWTDQKTILRQMLQALAGGHWLSFVMDQKPLNRQGPEVTFFGQNVAFVSGPAMMSLRAKAPILAVFCVRLGTCHYRLLVRKVAIDFESDTVETISQKLATEIESAIRTYPEQWCWNYKRWKV